MPPSSPETTTKIRTLSPNLTIFSTRFNRFAPFGYRNFVAVGNRATAIKLQDSRILLLNPAPLEQAIRDRLNALGGVDFIAADLGHHLYVKKYAEAWPRAKTIGVEGLQGKRGDVRWDLIYSDSSSKPENEFGFSDEIETVLCSGFITRAVAWYHKSSHTLIVSDLLMNLPATEQYDCGGPRGSGVGPLSKVFAWGANPKGLWLRCLLYYVATTDYKRMRADAKKIAEWGFERIVPCHGDVIETDGAEAWRQAYEWFLQGPSEPGIVRRAGDWARTVARRVFLM